MRILGTLSLTLLLALAGAAPGVAQQTAEAEDHRSLSFEALDAVAAGHESQATQQRAHLDELLAGDAVREVAQDRGIDMQRVATAAAGLSDAQVSAVTPMVATIAAAAPGTITIGVGTLIVILLILILVT